MAYEWAKQLWKAVRGSHSELNQIDLEVNRLQEAFDQAQVEIDKLNSIIDELRDENESLKSVNREMSEDLMRVARGGDA